MAIQYIKSFYVNSLWDIKDLRWDDIHSDVNILVGINGCGKTTLLDLMNSFYNKQKVNSITVKDFGGTSIDIPVKYIRSFDVPANGKRKTESLLLQALREIIYQNGEGTSFFDYRMRMVNFPEEREEIEKNITQLFDITNSFFKETGKTVVIDKESNKLVFSVDGYTNKAVQIEQLSSGEKQLLLILFTVFLQKGNPFVLLMDEPEISLHITWQDELIGSIRKLNGNCQLILSTHSPNIFAMGWEDKITFVDNLVVKQ